MHKFPLARTVLAVHLATFGQKTTSTTLWLQFKTLVAKGHLATTSNGWDIDAGPSVGPSYLRGAEGTEGENEGHDDKEKDTRSGEEEIENFGRGPTGSDGKETTQHIQH